MFKPNFRITPQITSALMQIEACRQAIDDLPIDAAVLRHLRETAALMTTHFSTQIEGNRLALPEVRAEGYVTMFISYICAGPVQLFRKQGSATSAEMVISLKMSPRTLVQLCREWIASGFLEYQSAARKNRSYRLGSRFQQFYS